MTIRALAGLVGLNAFFLGVGFCVLWSLRGYRSWREAARLLGVAYMLGVAVIGATTVWELIGTVPFAFATTLVTGAAITGAALVLGRIFRRPWPQRPTLPLRAPRLSLVTAVGAGLTGMYLEALFRAGRLAGLYEFDGWAFWVPKGQAIYLYGGLDPQFFRDLPGPSYPPLVPALEALSFQFMGSTDSVTLHVQFWFLLVGFCAAVAGLVGPRVPPLLLWPPLLLVLVTPNVVTRALEAEGDFLLDELFGLAVLMTVLWLLDSASWELIAATIFVVAAMLAKREAYLLGVCVFGAAGAGLWRAPRARWAPLLVAGVIAGVSTVPWRTFLAARHLSGGGPEAGGLGLLSHLDRAWPSLKLTLSTLFDLDIWLTVAIVLVIAITVAAAAGAWALARFGIVLTMLATLAFTWVIWSFPSLPFTKDNALNPIVRLTGSLVIASSGLIPLLLAAASNGWKQRIE